MTDRFFIVTNQYGDRLNIRSKPDTRTGAIIGFMTNGEGFQAQDIFTLGNQTWARISRGDGVIQHYACISIGNRIYAREQTPPPAPPAASWQKAIDAWARLKGFEGPQP